MTWIADLAPCWYLGSYESERLVAVGWLGEGHDFPTGSVDSLVLTRLASLLQTPFQRGLFAGFHRCDLCPDGFDPSRLSTVTKVGSLVVQGGCANLLIPVPAQLKVFACPSLIVHYMVEHAYRPPDEFCAAVLRCPDMGSVDYLLELSDLLPAVRPHIGWDLSLRLQLGGRPMGSAGERLVPLLREQLNRAVTEPPDRNGRRYPPTFSATALASLGIAARAGLAELEAAVKAFPDEVELQEALDRVRATVED